VRSEFLTAEYTVIVTFWHVGIWIFIDISVARAVSVFRVEYRGRKLKTQVNIHQNTRCTVREESYFNPIKSGLQIRILFA
jgi:hypothetical protein